MTWRTLGPLVAAIAIVGVVVALLAPSNGRVLDPVAKAADTTAAAGTAEFEISGSVGAEGQTIPLSGGGAVDMTNSRMRMSMKFPIPGQGDFDVEEIFDGSAIYMKMPPALTRGLPGAKPWMKMDLDALSDAAGVNLEQAMQANQQNPGDMLKALKGVGDSREVGHDTIRGADTTHYHAEIDMKKALEQVEHDERFEQMVESMGLGTMPVDVWIDGSGRVARQTMKFSAGGVSLDMTIDYTRFGVPVDVTPPPADQVMDAGALLGAAG